MANSTDRFDGHAPSTNSELGAAVYQPDFLAQFDGLFFLFCTVGLMFVIASQYARHRRRRKNLERMRAYWEEQRRHEEAFGADSPLRFETGFWRSGE
jgi:hypothetical protein